MTVVKLPTCPARNLGETTHRDSHGSTKAVGTDGSFVHVVDRIQGNVEVFEHFHLRAHYVPYD